MGKQEPMRLHRADGPDLFMAATVWPEDGSWEPETVTRMFDISDVPGVVVEVGGRWIRGDWEPAIPDELVPHPCPFCGHTAFVGVCEDETCCDMVEMRVKCLQCQVSGPCVVLPKSGVTEDEREKAKRHAVELWNARRG
jgi:hypothetical protein